jgi:hypothetical protein
VSEPPNAHLDRVVAAIARYLAEHRDAADSEGGIAEWWLPTQGVKASSEEVHSALLVLLDAGCVERVDITGGPPIWRGVASGPAGCKDS